MRNDGTESKPRSVELYEERGETSRFISAEINDSGDFTMYCQDVGKAPREFWGDSDYEFWVLVLAEHKDALLLALVEKLFGGRPKAVDEFDEFLKSKGIPSKWDSYI